HAERDGAVRVPDDLAVSGGDKQRRLRPPELPREPPRVALIDAPDEQETPELASELPEPREVVLLAGADDEGSVTPRFPRADSSAGVASCDSCGDARP